MGRAAPEGWFYVKLYDEVSGTHAYVYACSVKCKTLPWKEGPGVCEATNPRTKFLDVLTQKGDQWYEHTIAVQEGDRIRIGSSEVRIGPHYSFLLGDSPS